MSRRYHMIEQAIYGVPWFIKPEKMDEITNAFEERVRNGASLEISESAGDNPEPFHVINGDSSNQGKALAVMPLFGTMFQHGGLITRASGGTSTDEFQSRFIELMNNPSIGGIILEVHSPGGQAYGSKELSDTIYNSRGTKPVVAVVNSMCASAALYAASAADEIVITPGGQIGSLGTVIVHQDASKAYEQAGIKTTLIAQPPRKVEGNSFEPLSEEASARLRNVVDQYYRDFLGDVARNRGVTPDEAEQLFGGGDMLTAREAVAAGLADRIGTMHDTVNQMLMDMAPKRAGGNRNRMRMMQAETEIV